MDPLVTQLELFCLAIIFNLDLSVWHTHFLGSTGRLVIRHERKASLLKNAGGTKREMREASSHWEAFPWNAARKETQKRLMLERKAKRKWKWCQSRGLNTKHRSWECVLGPLAAILVRPGAVSRVRCRRADRSTALSWRASSGIRQDGLGCKPEG